MCLALLKASMQHDAHLERKKKSSFGAPGRKERRKRGREGPPACPPYCLPASAAAAAMQCIVCLPD